MFSSSFFRNLTLGLACVMAACSGGEDGPGSLTGPTITATPVLASISPETLVEGATAVIRGTDFSPTAAGNRVTVGGVEATVFAATTTQISFTVPASVCLPQRMVSVQVTVSGRASNSMSQPLKPGGFVDLVVGEMTLIQDPDDFCLQFAPAAVGAGAYLVGVGSAAERPEDLLEVSIIGEMGQAAPDASAAPVSWSTRTSRSSDPVIRRANLRANTNWQQQLRGEQRIRRWESEYFDVSRSAMLHSATDATGPGPLGAARATPEVGEMLEFKVPGWEGLTNDEVCTPIPIPTMVRAVGNRVIVVTDVNNPQADALTDTELQALVDDFDSVIYETDTQYFGTPTDLDNNGRIIVLFTIEVNKIFGGDVGGNVSLLNFFPVDECAASNVGELYYSGVPDPGNVAGTKPRPRDQVVDGLSQVIAHEFTHILQLSERLRANTGVLLSPWETEGQAVFAQEVVGHRMTGLTWGQDYDYATAFSGAGRPWFESPLASLALYYGYDYNGEGAWSSDTPETCTLLFRDALAPTGCPLGSGYGAAWSFIRYLADRYGPGWAGGEAGFMRDWVAGHPAESGVANVEALLGTPFTTLFAEWAAMHYVDGRVAEAGPSLLMSSWDLQDIFSNIDGGGPLRPTERSFTDFVASLSVRGGSTAYSLFTDEAARPAVAVRVRNAQDGVLGTEMRPHVWVVRTR